MLGQALHEALSVSAHVTLTPIPGHWPCYPHCPDLPHLPATPWQSPASEFLTCPPLQLLPRYLARGRGWLPNTMGAPQGLGTPSMGPGPAAALAPARRTVDSETLPQIHLITRTRPTPVLLSSASSESLSLVSSPLWCERCLFCGPLSFGGDWKWSPVPVSGDCPNCTRV